MINTCDEKPQKTVDNYIDEVIMWCGVIKNFNNTDSPNGLTQEELSARHNAMVALHLTMKEYINKYY